MQGACSGDVDGIEAFQAEAQEFAPRAAAADAAQPEQAEEAKESDKALALGGQLKLVLNSDGMLVQQTGEADTFNASAREAFLRRIKSVV